MSRLSYIASMKIAVENNKMLAFAQEVLDEERFMILYKSYRQLFWFQLSFPIVGAIILAICCIIFHQQMMIVLIFGASFLMFGFIIWLILSLFVAGKLWHKYVRWYKKRNSMPNLYKLFDEYM